MFKGCYARLDNDSNTHHGFDDVQTAIAIEQTQVLRDRLPKDIQHEIYCKATPLYKPHTDLETVIANRNIAPARKTREPLPASRSVKDL